jgi:hypothetical protein
MLCRNKRLINACADFGWGPKDEIPVFKREINGWRLGNGVVASPWTNTSIPLCSMQALKEIETHCNKIREAAGLPLLSS